MKGLGYFGIAGLTFSCFPYVALQIGGAYTTLSITAASLAGMYKLNESNVVNSIEFI